MVTLIPSEMKPAYRLVRQERGSIPDMLTRRSRALVKIRNSVIALGFGLSLWLPVTIIRYTPSEFFWAMTRYVPMWIVVVLLGWYVVVRTRRHAVDVLDEIAEIHPDRVSDLAALMSLPWYVQVFGPWYRAAYLPAFVSRMLERLKNSMQPH